jgi:hypothetical protein
MLVSLCFKGAHSYKPISVPHYITSPLEWNFGPGRRVAGA